MEFPKYKATSEQRFCNCIGGGSVGVFAPISLQRWDIVPMLQVLYYYNVLKY